MHAGRAVRRRLTAVAALAVAVMAASGCDRGDGRLSQREFVEQANAICARANVRLAEVPPPSLADPASVADAIGRIVGIQREALEDLRALEPPDDDELGVDDWLGRVHRALALMSRVGRAVERGDAAAADAASEEAEVVVEEAETFADSYGLGECSTTDERQGDEGAPSGMRS